MTFFRRRPPAEAEAIPPRHTVARQNDPFAFRAAHRRMAWMLRLSAMTNVALVAVIVAGAGAFQVLLPLKEFRWGFIRSNAAEDRIYRVEPISQQAEGFDLLMESLARRYVSLMLEIDSVTQTDRFREAFAMTGPDLYKRFKSERIDSGAVTDALDSGLHREILVESADKVSERRGVHTYAVDFVQVDRRNGSVIERRKLRAYLAMTTAPHEALAAEKYENPLGVRVIDMTLKERTNS